MSPTCIQVLKEETLRKFVKEQITEKCLLYLNKAKRETHKGDAYYALGAKNARLSTSNTFSKYTTIQMYL